MRTAHSPSQSANTTPGSAPPPLADYRDSLTIQVQASKSLPQAQQPPQQQGMQLYPPPGSVSTSLLTQIHPAAEPALRQQQMLYQRQHPNMQLARTSNGITTTHTPHPIGSTPQNPLRNSLQQIPPPTTSQHNPSTPHFSPPQHQSMSPDVPTNRAISQPLQSRPSSTAVPERAPTSQPAEVDHTQSPIASAYGSESASGMPPLQLQP